MGWFGPTRFPPPTGGGCAIRGIFTSVPKGSKSDLPLLYGEIEGGGRTNDEDGGGIVDCGKAKGAGGAEGGFASEGTASGMIWRINSIIFRFKA